MPLTPCQPVDGRRSDRFRPPFCPRKDCAAHTAATRDFRYTRDGSYRRGCDPRRRVPRFVCSHCGGGFSQRSFSTSYRMKRPELLLPVAAWLVAGAAHRQIARSLGCSHGTVTRIAVRLGRHAALFQRWALKHAKSIDEPLVLDHFETFVRSQVERLGVATVVGKESWFVYDLDGARYLRESGRSHRKRMLKRAPSPVVSGAIADSTLELLRRLVASAKAPLELFSDDHPAYRSVVRRLRLVEQRITHTSFANPDRGPGGDRSAARARDEALFAVDLLHKIIRHSRKDHARETFSFGRRVDHVIGRLHLLAVWRNFVKRRTERRPCDESPAMRIGLTDRRWEWREVLALRLFEGRIAANPA